MDVHASDKPRHAFPSETDILARLLDSWDMFGLTESQVTALSALHRRLLETLIDLRAAIDKAEVAGRWQAGSDEDEDLNALIAGKMNAWLERRQAFNEELRRILSPAQYRQALQAAYRLPRIPAQQSQSREAASDDRKAIETQTAINAAEMLMSWAKLFAWFVAIPAAVLIGLLALLGIGKYTDFTKLVRDSEVRLRTTVAQAAKSADKFSRQMATLETRQTEWEKRLQEVSDEIKVVKDELHFDRGATPERHSFLKREFDRFQLFLINLGYVPKNKKIQIKILGDDAGALMASYENGTIFINKKAADDLEILFRAYLYPALYADRDMKKVGGELSALHTGVADYLIASYVGSPKIYGKAFGTPRDLEQITKIRPATDFLASRTSVGASWASFFYRLRQTLGKETSDRLVLRAWLSLPADLRDDAVPENMIANMLSAAEGTRGGKTREAIAELAKQHGAPLPQEK